jgi:hypothetical protein
MLVALSTLAAMACSGAATDEGAATVNPASPTTAAPQPPNGTLQPSSSFEVAGVVTDESGRAVPGASVVMRHVFGGLQDSPASTQTDASGAYTIQFTSRPYVSRGSPMAARAEIMTPGFEWYHRDVPATGPRLTENFRLRPTIVIVAGDSVAVHLSPENGNCLGWTYGPCGRARVIIPADGTLTVTAMVGDKPAPGVVLEAFGGEAWGNPLTTAVPKAPEFFIDLGHSRDAAGTSERILLKTSFTAN